MRKGYFYIFVAVVMFTSFEVALKFIAGQINSVQLTLCRFSIGFIFLLPIALRTLKKRGRKLDHGSIAYFALLGLVGIALFVTFLAYFLLKEPIKPRHIVALALEILGTVIIISPWDSKLNMTGVALALLSTLLFSLYGVMGKRKVAEYGGAVVTCFSFMFGSLIVLIFILITHIPAIAHIFQGAGLDSFSNIPIFAGYTLENLPYVLFVSVGVAGIGFCTYFLAMEYQPASVVSLVYFFKPALSPVLAWMVHGEEITQSMFVGVSFIVIGSLCSIIPGIIEAKRVHI